jgi:hypothetical protein
MTHAEMQDRFNVMPPAEIARLRVAVDFGYDYFVFRDGVFLRSGNVEVHCMLYEHDPRPPVYD